MKPTYHPIFNQESKRWTIGKTLGNGTHVYPIHIGEIRAICHTLNTMRRPLIWNQECSEAVCEGSVLVGTEEQKKNFMMKQ